MGPTTASPPPRLHVQKDIEDAPSMLHECFYSVELLQIYD